MDWTGLNLPLRKFICKYRKMKWVMMREDSGASLTIIVAVVVVVAADLVVETRLVWMF